MEVWNLLIRKSGIIAIFVFILLAFIFYVGAEEATMRPQSEIADVHPGLNSTMQSSASQRSLQGVWKFSLDGTDILMALNQSDEAIWGPAKSTSDNPWNGIVVGSLSGNVFSVSLAALQGEILVSTYLRGIVEGDSILGSYVRTKSGDKVDQGDFTSTMISPDTSTFEPAVIEAVPKTVQTELEPKNDTQPMPEASAIPSNNRFKDVTDLAKGINPNIMPRMAPL
jgi:hypothetical protein